MTQRRFAFGSVLWFHHLHTNKVHTCNPPDRDCGLYRVTVEGKKRPMLLLSQKDGVYTVLYMTTQRKRATKHAHIRNGTTPDGKESIIDCSRFFEYNEKLLCSHRASRISEDVSAELLQQPLVRFLTYHELGQAMGR